MALDVDPRVTLTALLKATGSQSVTARADTFKPGATQEDRRIVAETFKGMIEPTANGVSAHAWSAHFLEVRVDEDFGTVRVRRMIGPSTAAASIIPASRAASGWVA